MREVCFLDLDNVLVDWYQGTIDWFEIKPEQLEKLDKPWPWDWCWSSVNLTENEFWERTEAKEGYWENLKWTKDGKQILELVEARFGRANVCLLTSPSNRWRAAAGKMQWIEREMNYYFVNGQYYMGGAKHFPARRKAMLIDDSESHINDFINAGGVGILIPQPWNSLHMKTDRIVEHLKRKLKRVDCWNRPGIRGELAMLLGSPVYQG